MSLFQQTILEKYLQSVNRDKIHSAFQLFSSTFLNPAIQENIRNSKEEQYQEGFMRDLFVHVLGYTLNPAHNFNLTTEYKNVKDSKKADGAILINGTVKAIIELKGTDTTDLNKIEPQAFGYKNNQPECTYVVISNFEKLRFYIENAVEHLEFNLFTLNEAQFTLLYTCLAYENIATDLPRKLKEASLSEEDKITKELYKDYSQFKQSLFRNMVERNPEHEELELFKKSQKLLDRFLFIFFAEDRSLLPPNSMRKILQQWIQLKELDAYDPLYNRFKKYFGYMNTGFKGKNDDVFAYNGGLFKTDDTLDAITIDDDILYDHTLKLSRYDYASEVDVNILGHIFEHSLNEIEEVKAEVEGKPVDKNKTKRKKDGVYYTPKYITRYIVENTVGKLCEEKRKELGIVEEEYLTERKRNKSTKKPLLDKLEAYREWLLQITICDPACGSGAFLNQALDFLITEHRYIDELKAKITGFDLVFEDVENSILENNLYGVDLNEESVEIAKLSLWLRTARRKRKLNSLNNNIKCGNSLIDDAAVAGDKAFNWEKEFPHVFAKGGFDVVIGNPPYVNAKGENFSALEKEYYYTSYHVATYQIDTYLLFIEQSHKIIKPKGVTSLIVPNAWLNNLSLSGVRAYFLDQFHIMGIVNTPMGVFPDATVDTIIFTFSRQSSETENKKEVSVQVSQARGTEIEYLYEIGQTRFLENENYVFDIFTDDRAKELLDKIEKSCSKVGELFEVSTGVKEYQVGKGVPPQTQKDKETRRFNATHKLDETFVPELRGRNINRYALHWKNEYLSYGPWIAEPREERFFSGERILIRQIPNKLNLVVSYTDDPYVLDQSLYAGINRSNLDTKYSLSLLNSRLLGYYFKNKYAEFDEVFPKIKITHFKHLPMKRVDSTAQKPFIEKADQMLSLHKELQLQSERFLRSLTRHFGIEKFPGKLENWLQLAYKQFLVELKKIKITLSLISEAEWETFFLSTKQEIEVIQQQIDQTDREIGQMVYRLYGLTEAEIAMVENNEPTIACKAETGE